MERVEPEDREVGRPDDAVERLGDQQSGDNYYYSFLRATMLLGLADARARIRRADTWIDQFRQTKMLGELVPTFNADLVGGGSREGTGYGVAMRGLWSLYDLWKSTTGEKMRLEDRHTRASLLAMIHQIVPTLDRSRRPAISRATRRRRCSTTSAPTCRSSSRCIRPTWRPGAQTLLANAGPADDPLVHGRR